jgi:hypothetical protein
MSGIFRAGVLISVFFGLFIFSFLYTIYKIINKESWVILWIIYTSLFSISFLLTLFIIVTSFIKYTV